MSLKESLAAIRQESPEERVERATAYASVKRAIVDRFQESRPFATDRLIRARHLVPIEEDSLAFNVGGSDFTLKSTGFIGKDEHDYLTVEVIVDNYMADNRRMKEKVHYAFNRAGVLLSRATGWEKGAPEHFSHKLKPVDSDEAKKLAKFLNDFTDESLQEYKAELVKQYEESIIR